VAGAVVAAIFWPNLPSAVASASELEPLLRDLGLLLGLGGAAAPFLALDFFFGFRFGLGGFGRVDVRGGLSRLDRSVVLRPEDDREDDGKEDAEPCDHITARNHRNP
jgi:hypothetical protein